MIGFQPLPLGLGPLCTPLKQLLSCMRSIISVCPWKAFLGHLILEVTICSLLATPVTADEKKQMRLSVAVRHGCDVG